MSPKERRTLAYWLTLAFRLEREPRPSINGLVLTADRKLGLGLLDLVRMSRDERPPELARYATTLDRLVAAEGRASAQAFLIERLLSTSGRLLPITDPRYPRHLGERLGPASAPTVLTVAGDPDLWRKPGVAISGSRKAGSAGLAFAREAGRAVAAAGGVVVSGLAAGVDREALEGALEVGGRVVGVAPEGILRSRWPRRPEVKEGRLAIVSEFAPDDSWSAGRAMVRNRTIAGLSGALVIADCVASGGTTDQLEVHRRLGLRVYVRRGPGEGALVDELCRRPGVTPWFWTSGPVAWPPREDGTTLPPVDKTGEDSPLPTGSGPGIGVAPSAQLQLEPCGAPPSLGDRPAAESPPAYPTPDRLARSHPAAEVRSPYAGAETDPVKVALERAGQAGASVRDLAEAIGLPAPRVRKRLGELLDATLIAKVGRRYWAGKFAPAAHPPPPRSTRRRAPRPTGPTLF